ncbi:protein lifeguard 2a [Rhinoraja longicauda]
MALPSAPPSYSEAIARKEPQFPGHQPGYAAPQFVYSGPQPYTVQPPYVSQQPYSVQHPYPGQQPRGQSGAVPPNWAFEQPGSYPGFSSGHASGTFPPPSQSSNIGSNDAFTTEAWNNQMIRHTFIRKVYAILMVQLLTTFGLVAVFMFCEPVRRHARKNIILYYTSFGVFIVTYLILACCSGVRRKFPWNIILLAVFTLALSYLAGMLTIVHNTKTVLLCIGITALVCLAVTIFSFQTKIDFTSCKGLMFGLIMALLLTGLVMAFTVPFGYLPWLQIVYAGLGTIVFTVFLAYDTQLLVGNKRYSLSPEEHIFAALCLYVDVVFIFFFMLQLFGSRE